MFFSQSSLFVSVERLSVPPVLVLQGLSSVSAPFLVRFLSDSLRRHVRERGSADAEEMGRKDGPGGQWFVGRGILSLGAGSCLRRCRKQVSCLVCEML